MKKLRLVGLTGYAQSGKDTVGSRLISEHGFTRVGFADALRDSLWALNPIVAQGVMEQGLAAETLRFQDIVNQWGWETGKRVFPEFRELQQRMGTEVGREQFGETFWTDIAARKVDAIDGPVVITDVRFANEAQFVKDRGGLVWKIERPGVGPVNNHASDRLDFEADRFIHNDGDIALLYARVDALLRSIE